MQPSMLAARAAAPTLFFALTLVPVAVIHASDKVLDGCYVPLSGYAESTSLAPRRPSAVGDEQLGTYRVVLTRSGWEDLSGLQRARTVKRLVLDGPFRGVITGLSEDFVPVLSHALGTNDRTGFIETSEDYVAPTGQDGCELWVRETLNIVGGTGDYSDVHTGSTLTVTGTVNACTGLNDFAVDSDEGEICFDPQP